MKETLQDLQIHCVFFDMMLHSAPGLACSSAGAKLSAQALSLKSQKDILNIGRFDGNIRNSISSLLYQGHFPIFSSK